jgi:hypothetical protein
LTVATRSVFLWDPAYYPVLNVSLLQKRFLIVVVCRTAKMNANQDSKSIATQPGVSASNSPSLPRSANSKDLQRLPLQVYDNRWGKQFNPRLLALSLELTSARDAANCSAVCKGWRLAQNLEDRLFQSWYAADWEAETANRAEIAPTGAATAWKTRYSRRMQVHRNFRRGTCVTRGLSPNSEQHYNSFMSNNSGLLVAHRSDGLDLFSAPECKLLAELGGNEDGDMSVYTLCGDLLAAECRLSWVKVWRIVRNPKVS